MTQTVELLLDAPDDARVRAEWGLLADAGLASQARHRGASNAPHVTLTAVPVIDAAAELAIRDVCGAALPLAVRLGPLHVFGDDPLVLVRLLVVTGPLQDLQAAVSDRVVVPDGSWVSPDRWTPHVTLAHRMPGDQLARAREVLPDEGYDVRLTRARRWDSDARRAWSV